METKAESPYLTHYILKYTLTDKEMEDYHYLHDYFTMEALFANQAIDALKEPEVVSESRITVEAYNGILKELKKDDFVSTKLNGDKVSEFLLLDINKTDWTFDILLVGKYRTGYNMTSSSYIAKATVSEGSEFIRVDTNNTLYGPTNSIWVKEELNNNSAEKAKLFQTDTTQHVYSSIDSSINK